MRSMLVTQTKSYLCESVLVQKTLAELGVLFRLLGMQPVRASNGRNGEASQRYFAGRRVGRSDVRASTLWAKHGIEPRLGLRRQMMRVPSPATLVRGAVMRRKRRIIQTG